MGDTDCLDGFKQIAAHLETVTGRRVSEDSARRYSRREQDPLPVEWWHGRVRASKSAVATWARRQFSSQRRVDVAA